MSPVGALAVLGELMGWVQEQPGLSLEQEQPQAHPGTWHWSRRSRPEHPPWVINPGLCLPWETLSKQEEFASLVSPWLLEALPSSARLWCHRDGITSTCN